MILENYIENMIQNGNINHIYLTEGAILGLIGFIIYLEASPKLGNIWLRKDKNNIKKLQISSLIEYFKKPFQNIILWYPNNWDLNPYMVSTISSISFWILRSYLDSKIKI